MVPLQFTLPELPLPSIQLVAVAIIFYIAGTITPYYYMMERVRGFGRAVAAKLPYRPPPGLSEDEAMKEAVSEGRGFDTSGEDDDGHESG